VLIHDTHHPITGYLYYEQQRAPPSCARNISGATRAPKFLRYFERVLAKSGGPYLLGRRLSYVDLSLFQIVEGLRYAFPKRMKRMEKSIPRVVALHGRVASARASRPISPRSGAFRSASGGIYRYFKELDG